jgi:putative Mn2+ efflux pump MntP
MSATKTVGFVVLIGVGIYGVYYFLNRKVEAAETKATSQLDAISAGLKGTVTGIAASLGAGVKALTGGLTKAGTAGTATTAAAAASKFVGPVQPAVAGTGYTGSAGAVGIGGAIVTGAMILYAAFNRLFPKADPEWEAIERRLQQARESGEPILSTVSKAQLKAPVR